MERSKVIEYIQTPLYNIPIQTKLQEITNYCLNKGKDIKKIEIFIQYLRLTNSVNPIFLEILEEYKNLFNINIWFNEKEIILVK